MFRPSKNQRRPNLSWFSVMPHIPNQKVMHDGGCGALSQFLGYAPWPIGRPPEDAPGVIFCDGCGTRAGRRLTRLLKHKEGMEQVRPQSIKVKNGTNQSRTEIIYTLKSSLTRKNTTTKNGRKAAVLLRQWWWSLDTEEEYPEPLAVLSKVLRKPQPGPFSNISVRPLLKMDPATRALVDAATAADVPAAIQSAGAEYLDSARAIRAQRRSRIFRDPATEPHPQSRVGFISHDLAEGEDRFILTATLAASDLQNQQNFFLVLDRRHWSKAEAVHLRNLLRDKQEFETHDAANSFLVAVTPPGTPFQLFGGFEHAVRHDLPLFSRGGINIEGELI